LGTATLEQLQDLVGVYALDSSPKTTFTVKTDHGKAIGQINKYPPFELEPTTEQDPIDTTLSFRPSERGERAGESAGSPGGARDFGLRADDGPLPVAVDAILE
jgi:hypothetical protein